MRTAAASLLVALAVAALVAGLGVSLVDSASVVDEGRTGMETVGPLAAGRSVRITFASPLPSFGTVSLLLGTYHRANRSTLVATMEEQDGAGWRAVARQEFAASAVEDNAWWRWRLPRSLAGGAGRRYRLTLSSPDASPANAVTAWVVRPEELAATPVPGPGRPLLEVDGRAREGAIPMGVEKAARGGVGVGDRLRGVLPPALAAVAFFSAAASLVLGAGSLLALALRAAGPGRAAGAEAP